MKVCIQFSYIISVINMVSTGDRYSGSLSTIDVGVLSLAVYIEKYLLGDINHLNKSQYFERHWSPQLHMDNT